MFDLDELLEARHERGALWAACCRHEITYPQLLERMAVLKRRFGDALYGKTGRR